MEIKANIQGLLTYLTMLAWLTGFVTSIIKKKNLAEWFFFGGFIIATVSFVYRGLQVDHIPMQNTYEVFLTMGMLIYPISVFAKEIQKIGLEEVDMLLGLIILFPVGFVFDAEPKPLPPALQSWLFGPHVAVYLLAYVIMTKAAIQAAAGLPGRVQKDPALADYERGAYRLICLGFPFLTLGLILGSVWGHLAWGRYWGWDPKELWSLVTWLVYLLYFHFRYMFGRKYVIINNILVIIGFLAIIVTLFVVNFANIFKGLHSYA